MATRKKQPEKKVLNEVRASAHKIWLAGLGAVSMAEEEGSRVFKHLVDRGEDLEVVGKKGVSSVRKRAGATWSSLEEGFEERLAGALKRLGVPTAAELRDIQRRLDRLEKKPATRKSPAGRKKATTRKKTTS